MNKALPMQTTARTSALGVLAASRLGFGLAQDGEAASDSSLLLLGLGPAV